MLLLPHDDVRALGLALFIAVAPLALLMAWRPAYRVAPITAAILLLTPDLESLGPLLPAGQRLVAIGIGSVIALAVAMFFLPARAHAVLAGAAGRALTLMADLLDLLVQTTSGETGRRAIVSLHAGIRRAIADAEAAAEEAIRENRNHLANGPDPEPLCRNLRRLSSDLSMIGRASARPDSGSVCAGFDQAMVDAAHTVSAFMRASSVAISNGGPSPSLDEVHKRLRGLDEAMAALRQSGALGDLSGEAVSRIFSLAFSFQQLHRNLVDLGNRVDKLSQSARGRGR